MTSCRWIAIACAFMTLAGAANAVPVSGSTYQEWSFYELAYAGAGADPQFDNRFIPGSRTFYDETLRSTGTLGEATSRAAGQLISTIDANDDHYFMDLAVDLAVDTHIDSQLAGTNARAAASAELEMIRIAFVVTEPVHYSGSFDLFVDDGSRYGTGLGILSGSILQPGLYFGSQSTAAWLNAAADSTVIGQPTHGTASGHFGFDFIRVPVPATSSLFALGLGLLGWSRWRARAHAS